MVSRIELREKNGEWEFYKNVMPGSVTVLDDPQPDGGKKHLAVLCTESDEETVVISMSSEEYEKAKEGECFNLPQKPVDYVLELGDPHYVTTIQPSDKIDRIEMRISHQDKF